MEWDLYGTASYRRCPTNGEGQLIRGDGIWYKFTGEEAHPLLPDEQAPAYKALPRDPEVIKVYKKIAGPGPLPARK